MRAVAGSLHAGGRALLRTHMSGLPDSLLCPALPLQLRNHPCSASLPAPATHGIIHAGGCFSPEYALHGEMANLRVWNRVLSRWVDSAGRPC